MWSFFLARPSTVLNTVASNGKKEWKPKKEKLDGKS